MSDPTVWPHPAHTYLAAVDAALADLPDVERTELLAEVEEHLAEALRELDPDADHHALVARLGTPTAYAAELRAGAGLAPLPEPAKGQAPSLERESIRDWLAALAAAPVLRESLSYLRDLRPAWCAFRGYLLVALALAISTQGLQILPSGVADIGRRQLAHPALGDLLHTLGYYDQAFADPGPNTGHPVYLLIVLAAVIASVALGRATPRLPVSARLFIGALDLAAVFTFLRIPHLVVGPGVPQLRRSLRSETGRALRKQRQCPSSRCFAIARTLTPAHEREGEPGRRNQRPRRYRAHGGAEVVSRCLVPRHEQLVQSEFS